MKKYSADQLVTFSNSFEKLANKQLVKTSWAQIAIFVAMIVVPIIVESFRDSQSNAQDLKKAIDNITSELDDIQSRFDHPVWQTMKDTAKSSWNPFVAMIGAPIAAYNAYQLEQVYPKYKPRIDKFKTDLVSLNNSFNNLIKDLDTAKQSATPEIHQKLTADISSYYDCLRKVQTAAPIIEHDMNDMRTVMTKIMEGGSLGILNSDFTDVLKAMGPLNAKISETIEKVDEATKLIQKSEQEAQEKAKTQNISGETKPPSDDGLGSDLAWG
jgi:hypothetical protein